MATDPSNEGANRVDGVEEARIGNAECDLQEEFREVLREVFHILSVRALLSFVLYSQNPPGDVYQQSDHNQDCFEDSIHNRVTTSHGLRGEQIKGQQGCKRLTILAIEGCCGTALSCRSGFCILAMLLSRFFTLLQPVSVSFCLSSAKHSTNTTATNK